MATLILHDSLLSLHVTNRAFEVQAPETTQAISRQGAGPYPLQSQNKIKGKLSSNNKKSSSQTCGGNGFTYHASTFA